MSDMPDEVWLVEIPPSIPMAGGVYIAERAPNDGTRYIRADLYERMSDELDTALQRAEQAEAERGRLRAALERAREMAEDGKTSSVAMQLCEQIEVAAQEALSHD